MQTLTAFATTWMNASASLTDATFATVQARFTNAGAPTFQLEIAIARAAKRTLLVSVVATASKTTTTMAFVTRMKFLVAHMNWPTTTTPRPQETMVCVNSLAVATSTKTSSIGTETVQ